MAPTNEKSFWKKLFSKTDKRASPPSAEFERYVRPAPERAAPAQAARQARHETGIFVEEAIRERRYETAAINLTSRGKPVEAEQLGNHALTHGKYAQAATIFTRIGNHAKAAEANDLAARDCVDKGGSKKRAASLSYAAIQEYGQSLAQKDVDRVETLKKMILLCDVLGGLLDESGDYVGSADTYVYEAQLAARLAPVAENPQRLLEDPQFYDGLEQRILDRARWAKDLYQKHVDERNISPQTKEGEAIIAKLVTVQDLLDGTASGA
ncbi:MAG: hypothetical protein ACQEXJ_24650 [Myxococcota bacterium]